MLDECVSPKKTGRLPHGASAYATARQAMENHAIAELPSTATPFAAIPRETTVAIFPPQAARSRRGEPSTPSREFSFAVHQVQQAIEPYLSLKHTLLNWNEIARALAENPRTRSPQRLVF
jgi:hypothetical protein